MTERVAAFEVVAEPCETIVDMLTRLLAEARSGRIKMAAVAFVNERGQGLHEMAWDKDQNRLTLVGAVARCEHRLLNIVARVDDELEE